MPSRSHNQSPDHGGSLGVVGPGVNRAAGGLPERAVYTACSSSRPL